MRRDDDWGERRSMGNRGPPGPSPWMDRGDHCGPQRGGWDGPSDGWEGGNGRGGGMKRMRMDDMGGGGDLRQENQQLMAENQELRRKVEELTVTNKFLLDLNAQMRLGGGGGGTGGGIGGNTGYSSGGQGSGYSSGAPGYGGGAVFSTGGGR